MNVDSIGNQLVSLLLMLLITVGVLLLLILLGYGLLIWYKWKDREEKSLKLVTLLVAVPQDNEVKIDAMEQIIGSFSSMYKSAKIKWLQGFIGQESATLEIVGTDEDIKF
ncbi:MAG: hypothetical protein WDA13_01035, partial [Candidatus Shapirobacteria bacterium]